MKPSHHPDHEQGQLKHRQEKGATVARRSDLEHPAHPLEAVFLRGVGPLLGHNHYPLIVKDGD